MKTYEFTATDVGEYGDVNSQGDTKGEGDIKELSNIWNGVGACRQVVGAGGIKCDLSTGKSQREEHESSDELSQKSCGFCAKNMMLSSVFRGRCG